VHECGGNIASLLLYKMQPKYFYQFSISKKYFILQNVNQSKNLYITNNENIDSFNALLKPFMRIYELF
jgi:hypothetical protein